MKRPRLSDANLKRLGIVEQRNQNPDVPDKRLIGMKQPHPSPPPPPPGYRGCAEFPQRERRKCDLVNQAMRDTRAYRSSITTLLPRPAPRNTPSTTGAYSAWRGRRLMKRSPQYKAALLRHEQWLIKSRPWLLREAASLELARAKDRAAREAARTSQPKILFK